MFKLLKYFSIASLVTIVLAATLLAVMYRQLALRDLLRLGEDKSVALAQHFANSLWSEFAPLVESASVLSAVELRASPETARLREAVLAHMKGSSVARVKLYNLSGLTVFSTEASQIGENSSANAGFFAARSGVVASQLVRRDAFSAFEGEIFERDLLSSYIPIRPGGPAGSVEAVFEIYDDMTPLMQRMALTGQIIVGGAILILGALYAVLFLMVRHADGIIKRQYTEIERTNTGLAEARDALTGLNEQLEQKVLERTDALTAEVEERKKTAESLRQLNEELQMFAYTAAHDLRAPLVTVQGFAGMLRKDIENDRPDRVTEDMRLIETGVSKMQYLLKGILDYGRIGRTVQPAENVPFREIVDESLQQLSGQLESSGARILVADDFPVVTVDRVAMVHALSNLVQNSTEYLSKTRALTIEIGHRLSEGETVFYVRDNGIGISPDQLEKVFTPFYRGARESQGSGLGLAIVKRIIEGHGGRVWLEGEEGKGTSVCFTLGVRATGAPQ